MVPMVVWMVHVMLDGKVDQGLASHMGQGLASLKVQGWEGAKKILLGDGGLRH